MSFGPIAGIMGRMGGLMFGAQVGQALGKLADEVVTSTDVGLPLAPAGTGVLVPQNVADFAAGLDRPADEVRLFLALREAASQRLFAHVPVAAPAAAGRRARLRARHHHRPRGDRARHQRGDVRHGGRASTRATPRASSSCWAAACSSRRRRPSSRWRCAGWRRCSRWSRAGWTPSSPRPPRTGCRATRRWPRPCAGGGPPAARPSRPSPRWSGCELRPRRLRDAATVWGAMGPALRQRRARPAVVAPRPAADVGRPRRAAGLRRPAGHGRRSGCAHRRATPEPGRTGRPTEQAPCRAPPRACEGWGGRGPAQSTGSPPRRVRLPRVVASSTPSRKPAGPLGPRVAGDERPEALVVARARAGARARAPGRSRRRTRASPAAGWTAGCCGRPACTSPSAGAGCPPSARWPARPARRGGRPTAPRARAISSSSPPSDRRRRSSRVCSLATICATQRRSSAGLNAAGMSTTVRPSSR